uniref:Uncharacterized protein n=1 Tax=Arundo donax TaxID=35708 RepID=A0A0A9BEP0_ARUDO
MEPQGTITAAVTSNGASASKSGGRAERGGIASGRPTPSPVGDTTSFQARRGSSPSTSWRRSRARWPPC